jgi:2',3'-cyclic-nucleotide 2'-phosphodiesterase (5'-nucleotidase family)
MGRFGKAALVGAAFGMLAATAAVLSPAGGAGAAPASQPDTTKPRMELVGRYDTGGGLAAAEIVAYSDSTMYVLNKHKVDVVDVSNPAAPVRTAQLDLSAYGGEPTHVAAWRNFVAVTVPAAVKTDPGRLVLFDAAQPGIPVVAEVETGALPDMVTFASNGGRLLVANEGEPNSYGQPTSVDPEGSVTIVNRRRLLAGKPGAVTTVGFAAFNVGGPRHGETAGVRLNGPGASVAQDLEPEYITARGRTAWVTLQENNAVAVIDIPTATVTSLRPLGTKDHSVPGSGLDASDRDGTVAPGPNRGKINIGPKAVDGLYQPDGAAQFDIGGVTYVALANEGDAREWPGFTDEIRVNNAAYPLDPAVYPAGTKADQQLGRLTVSRTDGNTDADPEYERITAFGSRSVSIRDADGNLVWDSGDLFEQVTAAANAGAFNANNDSNAFDDRSDNKGPEPEGVVFGRISGRPYLFVSLERSGGVIVLDVADPAAPTFVQYLNNRTYAQSTVGPDSGPEGMAFVPSGASPTGRQLLLVGNETTGTVSIYQRAVRATSATRDGAGRLTLLHNNDGESSLLPGLNGTLPVGGAAAFKTVMEREIADARNLNNAVLSVYAGDALLASATLACSLPPAPPTTPVYDAVAQRQMPYDVHALGNHEFDFTPDLTERFIRAFGDGGPVSQPFLATNLDFSGEPGFADLIDADGIIQNGQTGRVVGGAAIKIDPVTGQRFGIVSAITPQLATISSPRNVVVTTADIAATAAAVQADVDALHALGVRKIILVSHLQSVANDQALIAQTRGVDIAVAGGGDDQLTSPAIPVARQLLPGDPASVGTYPLWVTDLASRQVPIVTTSGNYKYVGRLDVRFNAAGELDGPSSIDLLRSFPRRVAPNSPQATAGAFYDTVVPDPAIVASVNGPVQACLDGFAGDVQATTEVRLNTSRQGNAGLGFTTGVRTGETNGGNLVADAFLAFYDATATSAGLPPRGPSNPVIAIQNGGGIRQTGSVAGEVLPVGGTPPGPITRLNTLDLLPFANTMAVVSNVTPAQLKDILERAVAAQSATAAECGGTASPAAPGASSGAFLQVAGFAVTYNRCGTAQVTSNPPPGENAGTITTPGTRVVHVTLADGTPLVVGGVPVPGAPNVRIVTNSFTAAGGDNFAVLEDLFAANTVGLPGSYEQALRQYIADPAKFPIGPSGFPTIPATDTRYALPTGEGRITILASP